MKLGILVLESDSQGLTLGQATQRSHFTFPCLNCIIICKIGIQVPKLIGCEYYIIDTCKTDWTMPEI